MKRKKVVLFFPPEVLGDAKIFSKRENLSLDEFVAQAVSAKVDLGLKKRAKELDSETPIPKIGDEPTGEQ